LSIYFAKSVLIRNDRVHT